MAGTNRRGRGLAVAVAGVALLIPGSAEAARPDTAISISSKVPAFHGRVSSADKDCRADRKVQLFLKVPGSGKKRMGRTTSSSSGRWAIPAEDISSGAYFAKAKGSRSCKGAKSKPVDVN